MKCPCQAWSDLQQQQRSRSQRPGLFAGCGVGIEGCGQGCGGVSGGWPTQDLPGGCCLWWVETNKAVIWWDILVVDTSCLKPLCFFSNGRSCFFWSIHGFLERLWPPPVPLCVFRRWRRPCRPLQHAWSGRMEPRTWFCARRWQLPNVRKVPGFV